MSSKTIPQGGICQARRHEMSTHGLDRHEPHRDAFLGLAKQRLADTLGSDATHGAGAENVLCAYLAGAVFLGLGGNTMFGWWWLAPSRPC